MASTSLLYRRIRILSVVLPLVAFVLTVVVDFAFDDAWQQPPVADLRTLAQVAIEHVGFLLSGALVIWVALNWLARRVGERDEAEGYLHSLYETSRQLMVASDVEAIVDVALRMPEQIIGSVATSVLLQEHAGGPWLVAGVHHLSPEQQANLEASLAVAGEQLPCFANHARAGDCCQDCPALSAIRRVDQPAYSSAICLTLSTEHPHGALLNVYLAASAHKALPRAALEALESMAAGAAVALDRARLRARELQILQEMDAAIRRRHDLTATLQRFLVGLAAVHRATAGAVFLVAPEDPDVRLLRGASWPASEPHPDLAAAARRALRAQPPANGTVQQHEGMMTALLVADSLTAGVVVLAGVPWQASPATYLQIAAAMAALMVRASQSDALRESQVVLAERNQLGREMHDGLAQALGFLNLRLQQAGRLVAENKGPAAIQTLNDAHEVVQSLYSDVRLTIENLRWRTPQGQSLADSLKEYAATFSQQTGLEVSVHAGAQPNLPPQVALPMLRIAQEALTNVFRHAQARHVQVQLEDEPESLLLVVQDDGVGLDLAQAQASGHFGLQIINERAAALNGMVSVRSTPNQGTRVEIRIPSGRAAPQPDSVEAAR